MDVRHARGDTFFYRYERRSNAPNLNLSRFSRWKQVTPLRSFQTVTSVFVQLSCNAPLMDEVQTLKFRDQRLGVK